MFILTDFTTAGEKGALETLEETEVWLKEWETTEVEKDAFMFTVTGSPVEEATEPQTVTDPEYAADFQSDSSAETYLRVSGDALCRNV